MTVELKVPEAGESISEVEVAEWLKSAGERVNRDDVVAIIETEKASLEVTAPASGVIKEVLKGAGESAKPGEVIGYIEEGQPAEKEEEAPKKAPPEKTEEKAGETGEEEAGAKAAEKSKPKEAGDGAQPQKPRVKLEGKKSVEKREEKRVSDAAPSGEEGAGRGEREVEAKEEERRAEPSTPEKPEKKAPEPADGRGREEEVVPMSLLRRQIAERLVQAQGNAALLTTFNEIDMSAVIDLRRTHHEAFMEHHGVKLGFMSFFVKATVEALKRVPALNAEIRERNIVYRNYFDIGIAIGSGKGLVVPVLRDADRMSFAEIERTIDDFAKRAQKNALKMEELRGGTFSITNGGIYGSLLSTPIVNPPQSGILGLHAIQERPVARNGEVVVRSMMYVALTYDHRIVDGREAVTALRSIKEMLEQPARILLEI